MANTEQRSNRTVIKIVVSALAVLFVLLIVALIVNLVRLGAANDRKESLAAQNAELERRIQANAGMIDYCQSSEFIEAYAREYLDMKYRGETMVESE